MSGKGKRKAKPGLLDHSGSDSGDEQKPPRKRNKIGITASPGPSQPSSTRRVSSTRQISSASRTLATTRRRSVRIASSRKSSQPKTTIIKETPMDLDSDTPTSRPSSPVQEIIRVNEDSDTEPRTSATSTFVTPKPLASAFSFSARDNSDLENPWTQAGRKWVLDL